MEDKILGTKKEIIAGVYVIRNTLNGKVYVGSSSAIRRRWASHLASLKYGSHSSLHLQRAWNEYGSNAFVFELVEVVRNLDDLNDRENAWMAELHANDPLHGYNCRLLADTNRGFHHDPESILKMRAVHTGKIISPAMRAKLSAAFKGKPLAPEHRKNVAQANRIRCKARPPRLGTVASAQTRAKMSASQTGRIHTAETRAKMSRARTGKPLSPKQYDAVVIANRRPRRQETRTKIAETLRNLWNSRTLEERTLLMAHLPKGKPIKTTCECGQQRIIRANGTTYCSPCMAAKKRQRRHYRQLEALLAA